MAEPRTVTVYSDYKSPYAYLAKDLAYDLERDFPVGSIGCLMFLIFRASRLRSGRRQRPGAREERNAHQWRRVRCSYMDCRRQAKARPDIRGPQKIWDSSLPPAACSPSARVRCPPGTTTTSSGSRSASSTSRTRHLERRAGGGRRRRGLPGLRRSGGAASGKTHLPRGRGDRRLRVPSFVVDGELFWGREHLPDIR